MTVQRKESISVRLIVVIACVVHIPELEFKSKWSGLRIQNGISKYKRRVHLDSRVLLSVASHPKHQLVGNYSKCARSASEALHLGLSNDYRILEVLSPSLTARGAIYSYQTMTYFETVITLPLL